MRARRAWQAAVDLLTLVRSDADFGEGIWRKNRPFAKDRDEYRFLQKIIVLLVEVQAQHLLLRLLGEKTAEFGQLSRRGE